MTDAERLADARLKYHSLLVGTAARVIVDQNGERVEYNTANRASLAAYISDLDALVNGTTRTKGPMKTWTK